MFIKLEIIHFLQKFEKSIPILKQFFIIAILL